MDTRKALVNRKERSGEDLDITAQSWGRKKEICCCRMGEERTISWAHERCSLATPVIVGGDLSGRMSVDFSNLRYFHESHSVRDYVILQMGDRSVHRHFYLSLWGPPDISVVGTRGGKLMQCSGQSHTRKRFSAPNVNQYASVEKLCIIMTHSMINYEVCSISLSSRISKILDKWQNSYS